MVFADCNSWCLNSVMLFVRSWPYIKGFTAFLMFKYTNSDAYSLFLIISRCLNNHNNLSLYGYSQLTNPSSTTLPWYSIVWNYPTCPMTSVFFFCQMTDGSIDNPYYFCPDKARVHKNERLLNFFFFLFFKSPLVSLRLTKQELGSCIQYYSGKTLVAGPPGQTWGSSEEVLNGWSL